MRELSGLKGTSRIPSAVVLYQKPHVRGFVMGIFSTEIPSGEGIYYNLLTTLKVLSALLGGYVFLNTKGSRIVRILLCLKYDLQPELGSGLLSRWRLRPILPGSRVTRRAWRLATLAWSKWRSRKKKSMETTFSLVLRQVKRQG